MMNTVVKDEQSLLQATIMSPARAKPLARRKLTASLEDYLEAVYVLIGQDGVARVRDIAGRLKVGMPSVTAALKSLAGRGLVNYGAYQMVTLSEQGRQEAARIARRHRVLRQFLVEVIGIEPADAEANACRMEHAMDDRVLERFRQFVEFTERCPRVGIRWAKRFQEFCSQAARRDERQCRACLAGSIEELSAEQADEQPE